MATAEMFACLVSLRSVQHAIKAEKLLLAAGIETMMIPTPREIDRSCGQCLLFAAERQADVLAVLAKAQVKWSKLYERYLAEETFVKGRPAWLYTLLADAENFTS